MHGGRAEHSLKLENEKYYYRRIDSETFFLRKEFYSPFNSISIDITGSRAIIGRIESRGGSLRFRTADGWISPPCNTFGIYIPPFSIYTTELEFEYSEMEFLVSSANRIISASDAPVLFPAAAENFDGAAEDPEPLLAQICAAGAVRFPVCSEPAALKVKGIIDNEYTELNSIAVLARRAGIENWELSRLFRRNFGISAIKYLNKLRTIEAVYSLLENRRNSRIIDIAFNVGFRDLSRFNKQFKSCLRFVPRNITGR